MTDDRTTRRPPALRHGIGMHGVPLLCSWLGLERASLSIPPPLPPTIYLPLYPLPLQYLQLSFEILLHLPSTTSSSTHLLLFCNATTTAVDTSGRTFLITNSPTFNHESERSKNSAILYYHCDRGACALLLPYVLRLSCPERAHCSRL